MEPIARLTPQVQPYSGATIQPMTEMAQESRSRTIPAWDTNGSTPPQLSTNPVSVEATTDKLKVFWERQFGSNPTASQNAFDAIVGILLPIFCLRLYPTVARTYLDAAGSYPAGGIAAIALSIVSFMAWLLFRRPSALMAGVLFASAILAFAIGVILFPLSLLGMFIDGVAIFGFSPFPTTFVYARNTVRAWRIARSETSRNRAVSTALIACLIYVGLSMGTHWYIENQTRRAMTMLTSEDAETTRKGVRILKLFSGVTDFYEIVRIYEQEKDPERRQRLANSYRELAREDIDQRLNRTYD